MSDTALHLDAGLHHDIPNKAYHRGLRSDVKPLSSSMAKTLVTKSPAEFKYESENRVEKEAYDEGQAVHELVLEGGFKTIDVLDFKDYRTKEAQAVRDASYAKGRHPILSKKVPELEAIADGVRNSPRASSVFTNGKPEVSALVQDPKSGIWLQARFDWLSFIDEKRVRVGELKTTTKGANPRAFNKEIADRYYHLSAAHYRNVLHLLGYSVESFTFVAVSKAPPHLPSVMELSVSDRIIGDVLVDKAIATYAACLERNEWPGYDGQTHITDLPAWAAYEAEEIAGPIYEGV